MELAIEMAFVADESADVLVAWQDDGVAAEFNAGHDAAGEGERRCLREREEIGGKTCTRATLGSTQSFSSTRCITRTRTTPPPSAGTVT